jgi:transcriptional regulator with XRE-family HTH domain
MISRMATPDVRAIFGANLRRLREQGGWSQEGFALHAGVHRTYVGGIERGERNVSLENIVRLARALKASPAELFAGIK